jgi:hypothetical protein
MRFITTIVACTLMLFVWSGLSQLLPWGVPTVRNFSQTTAPPTSFGATPEQHMPGELTTPAFDEVLGSGIATLTTDRSFAWIVSVPRERYDPTRYFVREFVTQFGCAVILVVAVGLLSPLSSRKRLGVLALFGVGASLATYGVMTNWWGLPLLYSGGLSANLVAGWLLAASVANALLGPHPRA